MFILPIVVCRLGRAASSIAVVGPDAGPGSRTRANVEAALENRDDVLVGGLRELSAAAKRVGLRGQAAASPAAVPRVPPSSGVTAALLLLPRPEKGDAAWVLVDASGRELWSGSYAISGKEALTPSRAAALAEKTQPRPSSTAAATPARARRHASASAGARAAGSSAPRAARARPPSRPWRARRLALGVGHAKDGTGFIYRGGSPYPGVELDVALAPLPAAGATGWVAALEFEVGASQRFASAVVVGGGPTLDAREQRLGLDAVYPVRLGAGTRVAPRVGYGWHRFTIHANAVIPERLARAPCQRVRCTMS